MTNSLSPNTPEVPAAPDQDLRQRAETRLGERISAGRIAPTPEAADQLIHELQVHQIELELQNEELHRTQDQLERSRARYFDLYDLAPVGYLTLSELGFIEESNLAVAALLGITRDHLINQRLTRFICPEDQDIHYQAHRRLQSTGERQAYDLRVRRADGAIRWVHLQTCRPAAAPDEAPHWWATLTDITARHQIEVELEQYRQRLEELVEARTMALAIAKDAAETANRAKSSFLANMSHELRTPLNAILNLTALARQRATDPQQADTLRTVERTAWGLHAMLVNVLDFAQLDANRLTLEVSDFTLTQIQADLTALVGPDATDRELDLLIDFPPELAHRTFQGDRQRLKQVLLALLDNAIKFTPAGAVAVRVQSVEDQREGTVLRFEVQDTGIGIAPADQARIFQPFEQADNSSTRPYGGSGLGLALSQRLVRWMGGTMGVASQLGAGSTFWFTVHLARGNAVDEPTPEPPLGETRAPPGADPGAARRFH